MYPTIEKYNAMNLFQTAHRITKKTISESNEKISYSATFAESLKLCYAIRKEYGYLSWNNVLCEIEHVLTAREELETMDDINGFLLNVVRHAKKIDEAETDKDGNHKRSVMFWLKNADDVQTVANEAYALMYESLFDKMPDKPLAMVATIAALRAADRIYSQERKSGNALSMDDENDLIVIDTLQTKAEHIAPNPEYGAIILDTIERAAHDALDVDILAYRAMGYGVADIGYRLGKSHVAIVKRIAKIEERYKAM